jgi:septal ring factor EnvC (AmiA/AmiB activator)
LADLYEKILPMTSLWSEGPDVDLPLRVPVEGRQINEYGSRQVKGEELTKPVDYAEFEIGPDAQVRSPGRGAVHELINVDDAGVIVCIDHGMGLLSFIGPVPRVQVKVGDRLAKNQVLGVLPQGGATPSRVSWLVSLNQAFLNPMLLVDRR